MAARQEVGKRVANEQAQQRGQRRVFQRGLVGLHVDGWAIHTIAKNSDVVFKLQHQAPGITRGLDQWRKRVNAVTHVCHADAQQNQKWQYKKQQQPDVRHTNDKAPAK